MEATFAQAVSAGVALMIQKGAADYDWVRLQVTLDALSEYLPLPGGLGLVITDARRVPYTMASIRAWRAMSQWRRMAGG